MAMALGRSGLIRCLSNGKQCCYEHKLTAWLELQEILQRCAREGIPRRDAFTRSADRCCNKLSHSTRLF
jgi:hypothetical protein